MKKFIKISAYIIGIVMAVLGALAITSFIISLTKGVEVYGKMYMGIISFILVFGMGLTLIFIKKDYKSKAFWIILGVVSLVLILDRFVFFGTLGYGSALFNLIMQGSAVIMETVISVLLILSMVLSLAVLFLSVMEKYTSKK